MDYWKLNTYIEIDLYPLSLIDEVFNKLQGVMIFTKVDIRQAFNQIRIHPDSVDLTTFRTRYGIYRYNILPFDLCNGPATFQHYINEVLFDLLNECCTVYIDDILIYSTNIEDHEGHVKTVLDRLCKAGLHIDIKKSEFSVIHTKFLDFIISTEGITVDPDKIDTICQWQEPETIKEMQSFLEFCNFYQRFIWEYRCIAFPLIHLIKTKVKGSQRWNDEKQEAFERLKNVLTSTPILVHFNPSCDTILETDASNSVAADIMSQKGMDGFYHPIAFYSKTLSPVEMNYPIHNKELLAVILALKKWKADLQSIRSPFLIITDHQALEYFNKKHLLNVQQID